MGLSNFFFKKGFPLQANIQAMKKYFMLLVMAVFTHLASAQIITVLDQESGDPLELVVLASSNTRSVLMTNAEGQADISTFKDAEGIDIRLFGYEVVRKSYAELQAINFQVALIKEDISLDQVVVSASRWSQGSREVPAKITSLSAREVTLLNPQTAADMLGASGEVFIQKKPTGWGKSND